MPVIILHSPTKPCAKKNCTQHQASCHACHQAPRDTPRHHTRKMQPRGTRRLPLRLQHSRLARARKGGWSHDSGQAPVSFQWPQAQATGTASTWMDLDAGPYSSRGPAWPQTGCLKIDLRSLKCQVPAPGRLNVTGGKPTEPGRGGYWADFA